MSKFEHQDSIFHLLLFIFREKLTGCFKIELTNAQIVEVWIDQGKIVTVFQEDYDLKKLIIKYKNFSEQKIKLIFRDFAKQTVNSNPKPLGYYLERLCDIDSETIKHIFQEQITCLKKVANLDSRYDFYALEDKMLFPWQEMTGLTQKIDDLLLEIFNGELDLKKWYLNYPASCFCLELNSGVKFLIQENKLSELEHIILEYANERTTLSDISKFTNIDLEKVQKSAFILNSFGFVEYVLSPQERAKFSKTLFHNGEIKKDITFNFKKKQNERNLLIPPVIFVATVIGVFLGIFQLLEFKVIDLFFSQYQEAKDSRITLVTINDQDLESIGRYPIPDEIIAQVINKIRDYNPRVIGLDMYRNLSIEPGTQELAKIFRTTNNLIGVEKVSYSAIQPNKILQQADRISFADLIIDSDGFIRRVLFSLEKDNQIKESLGTSLALTYLSAESINFNLEGNQYSIGKAKITPLLNSSGGYWNRSLGGYQMMLNYRGGIDKFNQISLTQMLTKEFDVSLIEDKIIIIGSISDADQDSFFTPKSKTAQGVQSIPGIVIHANHVSQLVSSALDGRPLLNPRSKIEEIIFICVMTILVIFSCYILVYFLVKIENLIPSWSLYLIIPLLATIGILLLNYSLFLRGWWLPSVSPIISSSISGMLLINYLHKKSRNRMFFDPETSLPNRYFLKMFLTGIPRDKLSEENHLLVITINEFSQYCNSYSQQVVGAALRNISKILCDTLENGDFVCRYNQNLFMLYFATKDTVTIATLGEKLVKKVHELAIPFEHSSAGLLTISTFTNPVSDI